MSNSKIYEGAAIPFSFDRQNGQPLDVTSVMRTLADITTYAANTEKKYVPYEGQTIACLEDKMLYILELKNGVLVPKLSGGVKLIKRDDNVELTDDAALSALRSVKEIEDRAISRLKRDRAAEVIEFAKGLTAANGKTTVSGDGKVTTLNLLVQALAEVYDLNVSHVATMMRTNIKDYVSSEAFTPGLLGEGFKISKALNGDWNLEIDNVVVRKVMTIFEMIISKVRSVNGGLVISDGNGRIKSVAETTGSPAYYVIGIEGDMQFVVDDYVRCQVFSSGHAKFYWVRVSSISGNSILVLKSEFTNGAVPAVGDDLVQMGNKTNTARQGLIYLTASEDGKPRISVMDDVNSTSTVGKNKVILGCLDGITDTDFPADFQPSGYGLYAMNVFLKGIFLLRNGKSVESEFETVRNALTTLSQEFSVAMGEFTSKITEVKEYTDGKVNAIQVGARNLFIGTSSKYNSLSGITGHRADVSDLSGESITYSFYFDNPGGLKYFELYFDDTWYSNTEIYTSTTGKHFVYKTVQVPANVSLVKFVVPSANGWCSIAKLKLERGNKPTDWTPAPEDVTADAQAKANAAQAAAEAVAIAQATLAKTEASAYADGIVTAEERRAIADAQAKLAEAKLDAQAKADAAKQAAINDAAGKYPTKSEVTSSINQKADEINLSVTQKIEGVQVGGRNYFKNATQIHKSAGTTCDRVPSINGLYIVGEAGSAGYARLSNVIDSNGWWTVSFYVRGTQGTDITAFTIDVADNGSTGVRVTPDNEYRYKELKFLVSNYSSDVYNFVDFNDIAQIYINIKNLKVERGNKPTDWTPAPEDVQSQITENKSQIQVLSDQIALKVSNDTFNALGQRVYAAESTLSVQANQIASKVSQNDFNTLGQRVGSAESAITQQATQISSKVSTTEFDKLGVRVDSAESEIKQQSTQIGLMVKKDDLTITGIDIVNRKITLTADSTVFRNNAGQQIAIFENDRIKTDLIDARAIVTGSLLSEVISATNITTGKLTVTNNAKIGEFLVQNNSLVNYDFRASLQIGDSESLRYVKIGGDSLNLAKIQVAGEDTVGLNITTYKPTVGRYPHTNYAIKSVGSHVFKQRGAVDQYDKDDIWDAPGVLWCGQYSCANWNPTLVRSWGNGLNVIDVRRQRAGCYTIIHNLGHADYFVHAIGNAQIRDNWNWWNTTVSFFGHSASQFSLLFKDDGGGEKDPAEFQVMIFGRNKF